jgi:hypothetical protein
MVDNVEKVLLIDRHSHVDSYPTFSPTHFARGMEKGEEVQKISYTRSYQPIL